MQSLPSSSLYTGQESLDLESKTVFAKNWLCVGGTWQITKVGDFFTGKIVSKPFVVVREGDDSIKAYYNICRHHATRVAQGSGNTSVFVCPYHAWTYNLSGELVRQPGVKCKSQKLNLVGIPIKIVKNHIFVNLSQESNVSLERGKVVSTSSGPNCNLNDKIDLVKALEPFYFDEYRPIKKVTYELNCNWKVFVDNYLDGGYHVPHMHKELSGELDLKSYKSVMGKGFNRQICSNKLSGNRVGDSANYTWVYPNLMINKYGDWMDTNLVWPRTKNTCEVHFQYFYKGAKKRLDQEFEASHKVQLEDEEVCHRVQEGLEAGVIDGVYVEEYEKPMMQFHSLYLSHIEKSF